MLQLLSPAGLWTLAALSLPLVIHLWRPPPRTVRLGSLRFLESLPRRMHNLRWREHLLLAARLALLALLALLLAGPRWQTRPARGPRRLTLLDPTAALSGESLAAFRARQSAGDEIHVLAPGAGDATPDLWSLLREADAESPAGSSLTVFSPGRLTAFRGARPALAHFRVEWVRTPDVPPKPVPGTRAAEVLPSPPLGVLIARGADRAADARYVEAAVRAAAQVEGRAVNVVSRDDNPSPGDAAGFRWVFWLSAQPVPSGWTEGGANVVSEEAGDTADDTASWIVPGAARLWRRTVATGPTPGAAVWTDGFGQPLLTVAREARGRRWRFFGRFDPAWTELVQESAFPSWLRGQLFEPAPSDSTEDRRLADPAQYRTAEATPRHDDVTLQRAGGHFVDLRGSLWMITAALFGLERFLAAFSR